MSGAPPDEVTARATRNALVRLHTRLNRVFLELFELFVQVDMDEMARRNAMTDAVSWVSFDLGISSKTARAWLRAAEALTALPAIEHAFRSGTVSLDELLILTRYATPENETQLLGLAAEIGVEDLSSEIRTYLAIAAVPRPRPEAPTLEVWWDETTLQLRGAIPGVDGILVESALTRLGAKAPIDPDTGLYRDHRIRAGEALIQMASESTAEDRDHDRATIVVHVDAAELAEPEATVVIAGRQVTRDELLRLTCDGRVQPAIDQDGITVGIGRVSRQIPAWLRRLVEERDGGCRFPGCRRTRWTHGPHIVHWADGGPTNLDNLITLCGFHHRLIHRRKWTIRGNPNGHVLFITDWGDPFQPARRQLRADLHVALLLDAADTWADMQAQRLATANSPP